MQWHGELHGSADSEVPSLWCKSIPVLDGWQGDRVMVISGDLKNLIGRVERVAEDGKVDIMPKMEGLTDILTFELNQLEKYFEVRCEPGPDSY